MDQIPNYIGDLSGQQSPGPSIPNYLGNTAKPANVIPDYINAGQQSKIPDYLSQSASDPYFVNRVGKPVVEAGKTALEFLNKKATQLLEQPFTSAIGSAQKGQNPITGFTKGLTNFLPGFKDQPVETPADVFNASDIPSKIASAISPNDPQVMNRIGYQQQHTNLTNPKVNPFTPEMISAYRNRNEGLKPAIGDTLGMASSFANPLMWTAGMGRLTKAGELAEKGLNAAGKIDESAPLLSPGSMDNFRRGLKSPVSIGNTPLISGPTMMKPIDYIGDLINKGYNSTIGKTKLGYNIKEGAGIIANSLKRMTSNPEFNQMAQEAINKTNESVINENASNAARMAMLKGSVPNPNNLGPLNRQMLDVIEPRGSMTMKTPNMPLDTKQELGAVNLPSGVPDYINQLTNRSKQRALVDVTKGSPEMNIKEYYIEHQRTPEATEYARRNDIDLSQMGEVSKSGANPQNVQTRGLPYTINEVNDKFANGQGHTIPELGNDPRWQGFTGKFFNDSVADLDSDRYLKSVTAENQYDFMQKAGKAYGRSANPQQVGWKEVPNAVLPNGTKGSMWFPKEMADYLNRADDFTKSLPQFVQTGLGVMKSMNNFVKKANFGIYPGSAVKIELGNQQLAYLGGIYSPFSQVQGHVLAAAIRGDLNALDNVKPFINHPQLGPLTQKQVYDLAVQQRGLGMGLFRFEAKSMGRSPENNPLTKAGWEMHNYVEDGTRMGAFIEALKQGYSPAAAGNKVRQVMYDYSQMSPMMNFARTYLPLPFLTFASKNAPAMLGAAFRNPGKFNLYEKTREELNKRNSQGQQNMDQWQKDNLPIFIKSQGGQDYYLFANRLIPNTDINEWLGSGNSMWDILKNTPAKMMKYGAGLVNPFIKTPVETLLLGNKLPNSETKSGQSLYFDQPIQRMEGEQQAVVPGINLPAKWSYAVRNTFRPVTEASRAMQPRQPGWAKLLHSGATMGLNVQAIDPVIQQMNAARAMTRALKGSGTQEGGNADVKYYLGLYARHISQGNKQAADLDWINYQQSQKNLKNIIQGIK